MVIIDQNAEMGSTSQSYFLFPEDASERSFVGLIFGQVSEYRIRILRSSGESMKRNLADASIDCDQELLFILQPHMRLVEQRLSRSKDVHEFMAELSDLVIKISSNSEQPFTAAPTYYQTIVDEMDRVGWETVAWTNKEMSHIHLKSIDSQGRSHILDVKLPPEFPQKSPIFTASLPENFEFCWLSSSHISDALSNFSQKLEQYQDFWDVMDEIDTATWVLEPENPNRSSTSRRIVIQNNCSIVVDVSPHNPRAFPEFRFFGADRVVVPFRERLIGSMESWDTSLSLKESLEIALRVSFPQKMSHAASEVSLECGICYSSRLGSELPDISCENTSCSRQYHCACLYDWLRSLATSRQSFDKIFGSCPYCTSSIGCRIVTR